MGGNGLRKQAAGTRQKNNQVFATDTTFYRLWRNGNVITKRRVFAKAAMAVVLGSTLCITPLLSHAVDFAGKKVTIIVPFNEGGGADVYARLFQPFMQKYLPGNPTVIVRNDPGGGSIKGANKFQNTKGDGLTAMSCSTSTLIPFALGVKKVKYDVLSWRPVILSPQGSIFYALPTTGTTGKNISDDIAALRKAKLNFGAKNPTSSELRAILAFEMLEIKDVNVVFGLSSGKQRKALLRGEIDINYDSANAYYSKVGKFADKGDVVPVFTMGFAKADGTFVRDPAAPDMATIPEAYEMLHGKKPSGVLADAFTNFLHMGVSASKSLVLPAGTPDDVHAAWADAMNKTLADPDFHKLAKKAIGVYPQYLGDDAAAVLKAATDMKPETRAWIKEFIKGRFGVDV
jgi:tripartite-type tricarboxylate transporter receptor subunit TctC